MIRSVKKKKSKKISVSVRGQSLCTSFPTGSSMHHIIQNGGSQLKSQRGRGRQFASADPPPPSQIICLTVYPVVFHFRRTLFMSNYSLPHKQSLQPYFSPPLNTASPLPWAERPPSPIPPPPRFPAISAVCLQPVRGAGPQNRGSYKNLLM
jgi:hypothetical protein